MYTYFTDTDTDITPEEAKKYGYKLISMPYVINNKEIFPYEDFVNFDYKTFYNMLRDGIIPTTCGISVEKYLSYFEPELAKGNDILYVHFSRAMTCTFDAMDQAIAILKDKYPERSIETIDTKAITLLSLMIVKEIGDMILAGKSVEEILEWSKTEIDHYAVYFYADDLKFFKRSGRVSGFSALMGNLIGIHPIIYMSSEGIMTNISKGRGRLNTLNKILDYVEELGDNIKDYRIMIGHSDCEVVVNIFKELLIKRFGEGLNIETAIVNPTAGSHCGPDSLGISFHAKHR